MIIGIDPGKTGAAAIMSTSGEVIDVLEYNKLTEREIVETLSGYKGDVTRVWIEKVASRPAQGVKSVFTFGDNYGWWRGVITTLKFPFETVTSVKWQRYLGCLSKGDKNVTKQKAQQLFPDLKVTHAKADAILIAEFGRRLAF